jgi:hypothetical protein
VRIGKNRLWWREGEGREVFAATDVTVSRVGGSKRRGMDSCGTAKVVGSLKCQAVALAGSRSVSGCETDFQQQRSLRGPSNLQWWGDGRGNPPMNWRSVALPSPLPTGDYLGYGLPSAVCAARREREAWVRDAKTDAGMKAPTAAPLLVDTHWLVVVAGTPMCQTCQPSDNKTVQLPGKNRNQRYRMTLLATYALLSYGIHAWIRSKVRDTPVPVQTAHEAAAFAVPPPRTKVRPFDSSPERLSCDAKMLACLDAYRVLQHPETHK